MLQLGLGDHLLFLQGPFLNDSIPCSSCHESIFSLLVLFTHNASIPTLLLACCWVYTSASRFMAAINFFFPFSSQVIAVLLVYYHVSLGVKPAVFSIATITTSFTPFGMISPFALRLFRFDAPIFSVTLFCKHIWEIYRFQKSSFIANYTRDRRVWLL